MRGTFNKTTPTTQEPWVPKDSEMSNTSLESPNTEFLDTAVKVGNHQVISDHKHQCCMMVSQFYRSQSIQPNQLFSSFSSRRPVILLAFCCRQAFGYIVLEIQIFEVKTK